MSWDDAMGLIVLEGLLICVLVLTGLREAVMHAIPQPLKQAISVGIGLFIAFIGFVDAGFVTRIPDAANTTVPVQLGGTGSLTGWPILVFCLGVLLTIALLARKVKGAILISIVAMTVVALIINSIADVKAWGLTTPEWPDKIVDTPDFGLIGQFSLFGAFSATDVGVITVILLIFTLILSDFFDTMGTVVGISAEAGLLDEQGKVPNLGRVLLIDGAAAVAAWCGVLVLRDVVHRVGGGRRRGIAHGLLEPGHRWALRARPVPHAAADDRAASGGGACAGRRGVPDDDPGQAHRLGQVRDRDTGVSHHRRDALHVLDHQWDRGGVLGVCGDQVGAGEGEGGSLVAVGGVGVVPGVLRY